MPDPAVEALIARAAEDVRRTGWHATGVFPTESSPPEASHFLYTTGLRTTWGAPDLFVSALPVHAAHALCAAVIDRLKSGDGLPALVIADGSDVRGVIDHDLPVRFVKLGESGRRLMSMTHAVYGHDRFDAVQMLWPDVEGRFPGEDGYADAIDGSAQQQVMA